MTPDNLVANKAFRRIDITAVLFCCIAVLVMRPVVGMYAQAGLPAPATVQWLGTLPWWAVVGLCLLAAAALIGKNFLIRNHLARLIVAILTVAGLAVGITLVALAVHGPMIQMMNEFSH